MNEHQQGRKKSFIAKFNFFSTTPVIPEEGGAIPIESSGLKGWDILS
jgi:hypothetical protein